MDDRFLEEWRREPPPEFARSLRERLRAAESEEAPGSRGLALPLARGLALAAAAGFVVALFAVPSMRAWAQSVLDQFRVRNLVAVEFDPTRLERLRSLSNDATLLVFDRAQMQEPGPRRAFPSAAAAGAAAGFEVRVPGNLPRGLAPESVLVRGEARGRLTVRARELRQVLDALELEDVAIPPQLDGSTLDVHLHPVVSQRFRKERLHAELVQTPSPEVGLPPGTDLRQLGEIGLRVLGLDPAEAARIASSLDWRSTLVVPVPADATEFREVTVHGQRGLLIESRGGAERRRSGAVVLWTEEGRVYAVAGNLRGTDLMLLAESVR